MVSLVGRAIRILSFVLALFAAILAAPAQSAPYAAIVMDARTGETLYEKNADTRLHPASLTKMMTLYIAFQEIEAGRLSLDTKVTISKNAAAQPPSRLGLKAGQKIAMRYLIRAAAVKSANDAATAIGEHISGSQAGFAKRMTKTARALGMKNTTFKNPNGLTAEGHLSTARDMTVLGRHLFYDFPQYYNIFSRRTADAGIATVTNTNSRFLDSYEGADGIKTGYTVAAGFNLTASAQRGNKRIIATVFGGTSTAARNVKMAELMDMGFGIAKGNVREKRPEAAPVPDDALVASAAPEIDEPNVEGGAAKTIRVSGEVIRSPRPKARPTGGAVDPAGVEAAVAVAAAEEPQPEVPDAMALAIAAGVESALAEATAAPEGTLDAQAQDLAEAAEAAPDADQPLAVVETAPAAEGTLEAQALALADGAIPAETPAPEQALADATLDAQALALAEAPADPLLAEARPQPRPEAMVPAPATPPDSEVAAVAPVLEEVSVPVEPAVEPAVQPDPVATDLAAAPPAPAEPALGQVTAVESVLAEAPDAAQAAPAPVTRKAPIFDPVEMAEAAPAESAAQEDLVVIAKSTSGGSHWGVSVGAYSSRAEAERALMKTGLAESATLNGGLKKIIQKGGAFRASFLGLTEDQANLACRRLHARGMDCETMGPG
ncbi:serine hydrolase [Rhodobacter sp. Har01]|uniref:D-alanyl-D-alanine carboxypeptidase family protein n=1 Tax=Rhodobacter sp. Har01 TaxID=2883999 RepID=UPI001D063ACB|nr:D-alanyl-D-alanine carboxypeptidase family protein [Rhodobacter sp. Har01]MCB6179577.1 serine hydrolase [Rhodobacter sp. Har01]